MAEKVENDAQKEDIKPVINGGECKSIVGLGSGFSLSIQ